MNGFVVLSVSLIFCLVLVLATVSLWKLWQVLNESKDMQITRLNLLTDKLTNENKDLLNRLMSDDLKTYSVMTASDTSNQSSFSPYQPKNDEAELAQLHAMGFYNGVTDVGETVYDDYELGAIQQLGESGR